MANTAQLLAYQAKLQKAAGDPLQQVWFDDFKKINRPFSEIQAQLAWVDKEIAKANGTVRNRQILMRSGSGL